MCCGRDMKPWVTPVGSETFTLFHEPKLPHALHTVGFQEPKGSPGHVTRSWTLAPVSVECVVMCLAASAARWSAFPLTMHAIAARISAWLTTRLAKQLVACLSSASEPGNRLAQLSAKALSRLKVGRVTALGGAGKWHPCLPIQGRCRYTFNFSCYIFDYITQ